MEGTMSKEFADKLLEDYYFGTNNAEDNMKVMYNRWVDNGYIKQSRKECIEQQLENLYKIYEGSYAGKSPKDIDHYILTMTNIKNLQKELIEIFENKDK